MDQVSNNGVLYDMAFKRKSFRRFNPELKISKDELCQISDFIENETKRLFEAVPFTFEIVSRDKTSCKRGEFCILIYSETHAQGLLNVGYVVQQLDLYLATMAIGTCWYGMGKPLEASLERLQQSELSYVIMIAIGKATSDEFRRDYTKAKRKSTEEFWMGDDFYDMPTYIKYAPSACNSQPWLFNFVDSHLKLLMKSKKQMIIPKDKISFYNTIDLGIMICFCDLWFDKHEIKTKKNWMLSASSLKDGDAVMVYEIQSKEE